MVAVRNKAGALVLEMVFERPVTLIAAAPPVAEKPVPVVVFIVKPPFVKLTVVPVLETKFIAVFIFVVSDLVAPERVMAPAVLFLIKIDFA